MYNSFSVLFYLSLTTSEGPTGPHTQGGHAGRT